MVLDLSQCRKVGALNARDYAARGGARAHVDADLAFSPRLIVSSMQVLGRKDLSSAVCRLTIPTEGLVSLACIRLWEHVLRMTKWGPGCASSGARHASHARREDWPAIVSDATSARPHFAPAGRQLDFVPCDWLIVEGLSAPNLVRRRDHSLAEVADPFAILSASDDKPLIRWLDLVRAFPRDPAGSLFYASVILAVRAAPKDGSRSRGP